ncbi:MAG: amidohydrolase [Alphaproteobacteria bacterium]|nr:amidohydrolase [Alphaproteobacteria bacterium]
MKLEIAGAVDCDVHIAAPDVKTLLPYMSDFWADQISSRFIDRTSFAMTSYPPRTPFAVREDWRKAGGAASLEALRANLLDPFRLDIAICHTLHGAIALFNEDMGAEICSAVNRWVVANWLDHEPRLRASILVHAQNPALAVAEIERCAADPRFVGVLLPVMGDTPLGRRIYWPIYEAAQRHGLPIIVHAGSTYRNPPAGAGWTSYQIEDYVNQSAAFENLIVSFLAEGIFQKFPELKLVCAESGFAFLPTLLWRANKTWRGVRTEVPWIDRDPSAILRERLHMTLQPVDAPRDEKILQTLLRQIACDDILLYSSDFPHWHFDGADVLPDGLSETQIRKMIHDNPRKAFPRLREDFTMRPARNKETAA